MYAPMETMCFFYRFAAVLDARLTTVSAPRVLLTPEH